MPTIPKNNTLTGSVLGQDVASRGVFRPERLAQVGSSLQVSHLFYADDAVFMGHWSEANIDTILRVLDCFYHASGLRINMLKSKLMGISVSSDKVDQAAKKIRCAILQVPFSYLGSKVGCLMSRIQSWSEIVNNILTRLSKWKLKTLSIGGRLTLLKFVLGSLPIYHMSLFKVQVKVLLNMESLDVISLMCSRAGADRASIYSAPIASVRNLLDANSLPVVSSKTRWIKAVPIKVNIHAWKVKFRHSLPTRLKISKRGTDIEFDSCPVFALVGDDVVDNSIGFLYDEWLEWL
ncbi:hypothetical protein Tco_0845217 [Tanacetum coccineum]